MLGVRRRGAVPGALLLAAIVMALPTPVRADDSLDQKLVAAALSNYVVRGTGFFSSFGHPVCIGYLQPPADWRDKSPESAWKSLPRAILDASGLSQSDWHPLDLYLCWR